MSSTRQQELVPKYSVETIGDRYRRCSFLNRIQHIDIFGKQYSAYIENYKYRLASIPLSVSSMSSSAMKISNDISRDARHPKLSKFSVTTKVSALYPGHDILSKRARKLRVSAIKSVHPFHVVMTR